MAFPKIGDHANFLSLLGALETVELPASSAALHLDRETFDRVFEPVEGGPSKEEAWVILSQQ